MASLDEKVIDTLQAAGELVSRLQKVASAHDTSVKKAAELIPTVVDTLVNYGWINDDEKQAAAVALADHAQTLELLKNQSSAPRQDNVPAMGDVADRTGSTNPQTKKASANGYSGGYVGRRSNEETEAWRVSAERLYGG